MTAARARSLFAIVGQSLDTSDPRHARVEVWLTRPGAIDRTGDVIYISKYRDRQIAERSVGLTPTQAREVAALLVLAADRATP